MIKTTQAVSVACLLLISILLSISDANPVQAAGPIPLGGYVAFIGVPPSTLCLGASTKIVATYLVWGKKGYQSPPPNATGMMTVTTALSGASDSRSVQFPSGDKNINYKATKVGTETLVATLAYKDYAPIQSAPLSFTVQKCDYYFSIRAHAVVDTDYGDADEIYRGEGWLAVDESGVVSGKIPIDWQFTLKSEKCMLVPFPSLETKMTVDGTMETVDRYIYELHFLHLKLSYDNLEIPSANLKCEGNKINIPFHIPSVNPDVALRTTWDPITGTGSRMTTQKDDFGDGKVVFAVAEMPH